MGSQETRQGTGNRALKSERTTQSNEPPRLGLHSKRCLLGSFSLDHRSPRMLENLLANLGQAESSRGSIEQPHSEFSFAGGQRVLLVEDNELVAEVLVSLLADAGNDVVTANSAEQAFAIVQSAETAFDAVISDYRLPTLSGLEVIDSVRQRWPAATAIILSGDTFDPRLHALSNTGVKVLRKPVRRETLAQALASGFRRGGARSVTL